ncbi:hypothetical protein RchiOBHm_Chr3g0494721 [Rosa chinensis]|uniref:Uncharacterized protein n=1 Tax=Rosa chinensis TaxID=74649 RepID=A0A2P6RH21_ROSCH|nr:hypothetical protein RchiOBHm_Chr3g0494721 [Rosa chinensis]
MSCYFGSMSFTNPLQSIAIFWYAQLCSFVQQSILQLKLTSHSLLQLCVS